MESAESSFFTLEIDEQSVSSLSQAAKWAKLLAIVGFVCCGLIVFAGIFAGGVLGIVSAMNNTQPVGVDFGAMQAGLIFVYVVLGLIYFFPCLFLYRFAVKMQYALKTNQQEVLNASFSNLKSCFKFLGVLTVIVLSIYALALVMMAMFAAFGKL